MLLAAGAGRALRNPVLLDAALALGLWGAALLGVARARRGEGPAATPALPSPEPEPPRPARNTLAFWLRLPARAALRVQEPHGAVAALCGFLVLVLVDTRWIPETAPLLAATAAALALAGAGLTATAARYLGAVDPARLVEAPDLARGARLLAWILIAAAVAQGLGAAGAGFAVRALHLLALVIVAGVCLELFAAAPAAGASAFPANLSVLEALGSRANLLGSLVDAAEHRLGIDLRSTWALTVVRRSAEPLLVGLGAVGWLATSLTVLGVQEQGIVERLGVAVAGPVLAPGLHIHWPWPIDRVVRIPALRIQTLAVGHEGEEESGPENVLWAREHGGAAEYTLLLGDGRDLIAIDATVQFRISDARAWRYHCENPADALRAISYRAVMQATVGRTLAAALSENVAALTAQMRERVQADADALGLGVRIVGFTVGGMHPPVLVATDYQAVVSAELDKTTAAIDAQAYWNEIVPKAAAEATADVNTARGDAAGARAKAAGDAWSFRTLEAEARAAPQEYRFRRRLETLERGLGGRSFTVLDASIQRDGGELWLMK